jgi:hypothetical protein
MAKAKALKKLAEKVKEHKELAALAGAQGAAVAGVYAMDKNMRKELQKQGHPVPDNLIDEIKAQIKRRRKAKPGKVKEGISGRIRPKGKDARKPNPKKKYTGGIVRKQAGGFVQRRNQRRQG